MRSGRLPDPSRPDEVVISEAFASAHGFDVGDRFDAILDGHKRTLQIVGTVLSPEFIHVLAPGGARLRQVKIGHRSPLEAEVVEGLEVGERVVLHPSDPVRDGVRIVPCPTAMLAQ